MKQKQAFYENMDILYLFLFLDVAILFLIFLPRNQIMLVHYGQYEKFKTERLKCHILDVSYLIGTASLKTVIYMPQ